MTTDHWLEVSHTFTSFSHNRPIRGNCSNKRPPIIVSLPFSLSLFFLPHRVNRGKWSLLRMDVRSRKISIDIRRGPWPLGSSQRDAEFITVIISSSEKTIKFKSRKSKTSRTWPANNSSRVKLVGWKSWATLRIENKVRSRKLHSRNVFCQTWIV